MTAFRFQDPLWIALLIPLVLLAYWAVRRNRKTAVLFSDVQPAENVAYHHDAARQEGRAVASSSRFGAQ